MFSTYIDRNMSFLRHPSLFHFILSFLGGFFNINLFSLLSLHRCLIDHLLNLRLSYEGGWLGYVTSVLEMVRLWFIVMKRYRVVLQV